jgi:hypothetical protein
MVVMRQMSPLQRIIYLEVLKANEIPRPILYREPGERTWKDRLKAFFFYRVW